MPQMKRIVIILALSLYSLAMYAQGEIQFTIRKSNQQSLSPQEIESLDLRLKQIFTRNSAASSNRYNVFTVEPIFDFSGEYTTEGLVENVSVVKGELTLMAKNLVDETLYYSVVIPVSGSVVGDRNKAVKTLIGNLKVTDPVFTRFIRVARKKINDYYAENCALILQRGETLFEQQRYEEAVNYLSAVSENLPCYEQSALLQNEIMKHIYDIEQKPDTVVVEKVVEKVVERVVEVPVAEQTPAMPEAETPVVTPEAETPTATPKPETEVDLSVSVTDLDVKLLRCYGNATQRRITIELEVVNHDGDKQNTSVEFVSAFTADGQKCEKLGALKDYYYTSTILPPMVKVKQNYYILNADKRLDNLSYVELLIRGAKVIIRNLPVEW